MSSNPPRLAKKAARKNYVSTDGPTDTGAHPISTPSPSTGDDSSGAPSTRGTDSLTSISTGGIVRPRNLATKSARKVAAQLPSTPSRRSTGDDDSDPPSTRSPNSTDTPTGVGTRPLSIAVKASRKVTFRDLPPPSSRRSAAEPDAAAPSSHHGRILASDELTTHRPQDRASAMLSRTDQGRGQSQGTRVSDRRARDLGYYRPSRSTTTIDIATAERRKWMNRHIYRELIPDGVTRQRVSRIATGPQSKKTGAEQQERTGGRHFRVSKRKSYLVEGKFVSPGPDGSSSTNDDTTDESEESTEGQPEQPKVGSKAARKVQFGVKSGRPKVDVRTAHQDEQHENLRDDSEEEDMSLYDTGDRSRTHDIADNDVAEEPTHSTHPRLPFLRRNVREGFKHRCKMLGVDPNKTSPPTRPISVTYPCPPSNTEEHEVPATSKTAVRSWSCVMCDLHGVFNNRTVLHKHLSWDHPEIDVKWNTDYSELLLLKRDAPINLATARSVSVAPPVIEEDKKPQFMPSTERRPTPSVVGNFGPTARHPYIPESSDIYSCRPGGPRLYDILSALPLEPFGVLSWVVVDREEELFELDDVLDEDKVMLALWYRWIFLNRNKFIASYFNGAKAFVTENWKLIRQAAGVAALRTWLLVLCVNNFLLPLEVVSLMQYYQNLAATENASG